jgi:hypothetical protein
MFPPKRKIPKLKPIPTNSNGVFFRGQTFGFFFNLKNMIWIHTKDCSLGGFGGGRGGGEIALIRPDFKL